MGSRGRPRGRQKREPEWELEFEPEPEPQPEPVPVVEGGRAERRRLARRVKRRLPYAPGR